MIDLPWKPILLVVAVLAFAGAVIWTGNRVRISYTAEKERDDAVAEKRAYQTAVETQARHFAGQLAEDQKKDAAMAATLDERRNEIARLHQLIARMATTVETIDAQGNRRITINPDLWLCVSTSISRNAADIAACETRSGHAGVPAPVRH